MNVRPPLVALALLGLLGMTTEAGWDPDPGIRALPAASDSALEELSVGRFWHAARVLRAEGAAGGAPIDRLILARAEAGWENWPAVLQLLEDASWLGSVENGEGLYLLGRALEDAERWDESAATYADFVASEAPSSSRRVPALARGARAAWRAGLRTESLALLTELRAAPVVRSWTAAELALWAAEEGDPDGVVSLVGHAIEPAAARALWRSEADALLNSGDSTSAVLVFRALREGHEGERRAVAAVELGRLLLASGDESAAEPILLEAFEEGRGSTRSRAAAALSDIGGHGYTRTLEMAQVLDRAGDGARALRNYDRALRLAENESIDFPQSRRLERARLMSTVRARQDEALEEFRAIRESTEDERIGARNLAVWRDMRRRQGMSAQASTLRRWLLEDYPSSNEAAEFTWSDGSDAEARGQLDRALARYAFLAENVRTHTRAGQARMRSGQIHLRRGDRAAAAEVYEQYLADFPTGRRWQEAAYWAGRTRLELGDSAAGEAHLRRVLTQPVEYYAVMSADLLGEPFDVDVPAGERATEPGWLGEGLDRLDMLAEAGLERGAGAEVARLRERAGKERGPRLGLAEALIERGRTIDGINIGWALLEDEGGWDQEVLRVAYPFPYRELVRREAAEWGVDPFMMAAIIRQESAFKADIVSRAGAIGLMQVMPPTGAELARAHGPSGFSKESLTRPEVNLHLGAAFFAEMSRRYDHELPLVLSAYNAGPTRATRWRKYPEARDPLRFTERIPFTETRGYVKNVHRNLGLYRALYDEDQ
jgi:soluble lytic murein transglycosylase